MNDFDIIELYFARNEQAIRETDVKYGRLCNRLAYNILNNNEDSEECVNDAYVGVWNAIPPTRPNNFKAFLCKIVRNLSLKRFTKLSAQKRSRDMQVSFDELSEVLSDENIPDGIGEETLGEMINDFLRMEKEETRMVFVRKYFFFDSVSDIASRYSFSESKVKNILFRARTRLKDYLIKEGFEL